MIFHLIGGKKGINHSLVPTEVMYVCTDTVRDIRVILVTLALVSRIPGYKRRGVLDNSLARAVWFGRAWAHSLTLQPPTPYNQLEIFSLHQSTPLARPLTDLSR